MKISYTPPSFIKFFIYLKHMIKDTLFSFINKKNNARAQKKFFLNYNYTEVHVTLILLTKETNTYFRFVLQIFALQSEIEGTEEKKYKKGGSDSKSNHNQRDLVSYITDVRIIFFILSFLTQRVIIVVNQIEQSS